MTFKILLNMTCPGNIDATVRPGINATDCFAGNLDPANDVNTDFVPVTITKIQILELDRNQGIIKEDSRQGAFVDEQEFNYTSIAVSDPELDQEVGGLQMTLDGRNANDDQIVNNWIILFTNECNIFPLFEVGDQIGWTEFVSMTLPQAQFCPGLLISVVRYDMT